MPKNQSKKARRQSNILDVLQLDPAKRVTELANELDVSAETVRRDLAELDASGRIKRTYGGAVRMAQFEPALSERLKLHVAERDRIARHAVGLLDEADSLFIGGGATTLHTARALRSIDRPITVLAASFTIALELAQNPLIEVIALPGKVEHGEGMVFGPETLDYIAKYRTPVAIVGASAIDEKGVSEAVLGAAQVYEAMIASAEHTIVVADSSKVRNRALRMILKWGPDTTLVTDLPPEERVDEAISASGARVLVAAETVD